MKTPLANENYDVRGKTGTFSAETEDAVDAAHKASAAAHKAGTKDGHERAARMHRLAAKRHTDAGDTENAEMHEGIATGHDSMAETCHAPALANELFVTTRDGENFQLALDNETEIDADGWALVAPYGEHPKTRLYRENGQIREQKFIQVLDNEAADSMMAKENSFFRTLKRALIGIPVYKGHGDLNDADPKAVANEKQKIKLGVVDQIRKGARGIEAHFALDNDGAEAVAAGWKFPSAFWWVLPNGKRDDAILAKPFRLISVALTPYPNISGVESLANAKSTQPAEAPQQNMLLKENIIGLLAGKGVKLPDPAGENDILAALANGDYAGHEFHGNQYAGGEAHGKEHEASRQAHLKSSAANDKASHQAAAQAHLKAAAAHGKAGDEQAEAFHQSAAQYHMSRAARFKS